MNLAQLTSADLENIGHLLERRENLQAQVAAIDTQLTDFESGGGSQPAVAAKLAAPTAPATTKLGKKPGRPAKAPRAARGSVKDTITDLIKSAGTSGIRVKEIAAKLGVPYGRVSPWLATTGKTIKEIKKVGRGTYAWASGTTPAPGPAVVTEPAAPAKPADAAKPTTTAKAEKPRGKKPKAKGSGGGKPKSSQHGELKESIIALVTAGGKAGILAKDVAAKLKAPPARIYNWFQTTGKKVKAIKKIGRGKYAWVG